MSKIIENTFRAVNIALVNELAILADRMGIDVWEAIEASATKPFGFMPFWPGPGLGGHCIPVDPFYLAWRATRLRPEQRVRGAGRAHQREHALLRRLPHRAGPQRPRQGRPRRRTSCSWAWPTRPTWATCARARRSSSWSCCAPRARDVSYHDPHVARLPGAGPRLRAPGRGDASRRPTASSSPPPTRPWTWRSWSARADLVVDLRNAVRQRLLGGASGARARQRRRPLGRPLAPAVTTRPRRVWIDLTNSPHVALLPAHPAAPRRGRRARDRGHRARLRPDPRAAGALRHPAHRHRAPRRRGAARQGPGARAALVRRCIRFGRGRGLHAGGQPRLQRPGRGGAGCCASTARSSTTSRAPPACTRSTSGWRTRSWCRRSSRSSRSPPWASTGDRYRPYPGLKEQVTLADFAPDLGVLEELGLDPARPIVVLRPPATMSLYHRGLENTRLRRRPGAPPRRPTPRSCCCRGRRSRPTRLRGSAGRRHPREAGGRAVAGLGGGRSSSAPAAP